MVLTDFEMRMVARLYFMPITVDNKLKVNGKRETSLHCRFAVPPSLSENKTIPPTL